MLWVNESAGWRSLAGDRPSELAGSLIRTNPNGHGCFVGVGAKAVRKDCGQESHMRRVLPIPERANVAGHNATSVFSAHLATRPTTHPTLPKVNA